MARVLEALMAEFPDPEYKKAYFDNHHPLHDVVVAKVMEAFLMTYGDDGKIHPQRDVIRDDKGDIDWDETYAAWREIGQVEQSRRLARQGIQAPEIDDKSQKGPMGDFNKKGDDSEKRRTTKELKADPAFMKRYLSKYEEGHEEAVAEFTASFAAENPEPSAE